jgi:glycerate kinase
LRPGFALFAEQVGLAELVGDMDLVITGEGCLDHQSLFGKGPVALAQLALAAGVPAWCLCGKISSSPDVEIQLHHLFDRLLVVLEHEPDLEKALASAATLVTDITSAAICDWLGQ